MEKKDYKDTLNLPQTDFPMKANLPQREPQMLKHWQETDIYKKMLDRNKGNAHYILHDGPPYANGRIHIGHALNKTLKDIIVKYKSMKGFYSPYVPGWDCHGLPIELEVDKKLGSKKAEVGMSEKRAMCRQYATEFMGIQREEFKRLGVFGDWDNPYLTMTNDYEAATVRELLEFVNKGYAYKGKKPVHWCPSCVTALAEAEVEHADKESPSVYVKFALTEQSSQKLGITGSASFLIWTTTPWTLPANLALAVNPDIEYASLRVGSEVLIVAQALTEKIGGLAGAEPTVERTFKGAELLGLEGHHPFIARTSRVIAGDFVSTEEGSGIVHIAPGHGQEDYEAGLREGLEVFAPVDQNGKFSGTGVAELEGQFVFKANAIVIEMLKSKGALLAEQKLQHSYPHCWRCKKPVIFRATEQWFISMQHERFRDRCLEEIDRVQWIPTWGKDRIQGMMKGRPDWCISRQRAWGVPITVFTCKSCGQIVRDKAVSERIISLVKEHNVDVWFERENEYLLPPGYKCACGASEFHKEVDILDVWFDSGVSHAAVLTPERGLSWPADMYLEGSDQHRGWFQSSLLTSVGTRGVAPYKSVLTHGFTVDGSGRKMSKSVGNVVAPQDIIKETGAEILRLWVSAEDYRGDIRISKEIIARLVEAYRKIRNTSRYLLGTLNDFDGGDYSADLLEIDRWAMSRLQRLTERVNDSYEKYNFHEVYHRLYQFCVVDMSSFYLDILKDRIYTFKSDSRDRRAAQWVLNEILLTMTRLMAPVLSFTAEEIWGYIKQKPTESVFLADFPMAQTKWIDDALEAKWDQITKIRNNVNLALEIKRGDKIIGNALEAKVRLFATVKLKPLLEQYKDSLTTIFIVSQVEIYERDFSDSNDLKLFLMEKQLGEFMSSDMEDLAIVIELAQGQKCQRCWNYSTTVGSLADTPELCGRCNEALSGSIRKCDI